MRPTITEPGVYDLTPAEYHADPVVGGSLSHSGAKLLLPPGCPAIYRAHRDGEVDTHKPAFDFGSAAHKRVLGVGEEVIVVDAEDWRSKSARQARDEAYEAGKIPILARDDQTIEAMAQQLRRHRIAAQLLDPASGRAEQTLVWRDRETGVMCRALVDWLRHTSPGQRLVIPDYKTAAACDPQSIEDALYRYAYYGQAAWYCDGAIELGLSDGDPAFVLIVQLKTPPYLVVVAQVHPEAVRWGARRARLARLIYRRCVERDEWPGYADDHVIAVDLPPWAPFQLEAAEADIERTYFEETA